MNTTLLVFTDGRADCLLRTIQSFELNLNGQLNPLLMIDDSANPGYAEWLDSNFQDYLITHNSKRLGFAGAVQRGLSLLLKDTDYVFWLEDDFVLNRKVNIDEMTTILESHPYLAQVVLKRQPINSEERDAGDILALHPQDYIDKEGWVEHSRNFSTNPNLTPYRITRLGWPNAPDSEKKFSQMLIKNGYQFAYLGQKSDSPLVEHIGTERVGNGY